MTPGSVNERVTAPAPSAVRLHGLLGSRLALLRENRLVPDEEERLLWPYREHCKVTGGTGDGRTERPQEPVWGDWSWIYADGEPPPHPDVALGDYQGEFLGIWVAAAIVAACDADDAELRAKVDRVVGEWLKTQQPDGYLGTFDEADRWKSMDVWLQAHVMIGLLTYSELTGDDVSFAAAVRVANRVLEDFGPGRRPLHEVGAFDGMQASAIVEPMMWLHRRTGEQRYLDFGRWIVDVDWDAADGPAIASSLREGRGVAGLRHTKAAEMLIVLAAMVELYRETGDERHLEPVLIAWEDVVQHHLYPTGSASVDEFFQPRSELPSDGHEGIGETCVTMSWIYLNLGLARLTGEARFVDAIEQTLYNHLLGAQSPDGRGWAYFVGLRDAKRYARHWDADCCPVRGTRALCLAPSAAFGVDAGGVRVNLYEASEADLTLASGERVSISLASRYPFEGLVRIELRPERTQQFALRLRVPAWCEEWSVRAAGETLSAAVDKHGYVVVEREWQLGDTLELELAMPVRVVLDALGNKGRAALVRGPLVYAVDASYLPEGDGLDDVQLALDPREPSAGIELATDGESVHLLVPRAWTAPEDAPEWGRGRYRYLTEIGQAEGGSVRLVPFFEAGNRDPNSYYEGTLNTYYTSLTPPSLARAPVTYQVWLPFSQRSAA